MNTNQSTDALSDFREFVICGQTLRPAINRDNSIIFFLMDVANESGLRAVTTFDLFIAPRID